MSDRAIAAENLMKRFGSVTALRDASFHVARGTITGFIGRNGAGKTTTLKIVSTLALPDDGRCEVLGHDTRREAHAIRHRIGFIPDHFELPEKLTLAEFLDIFATLYGVAPDDRVNRAQTAMQLTRTESLAARRLKGLSRGEQQRVGLARALIHNPDVLLLDEPAAGLDPHARVELKELLRVLRERGKTVFLSSHVLSDLEEICDDLVVIRSGSVVFSGSVDAFRSRMRSATRWRLTVTRGVPAGPPAGRGEIVASSENSVEFEGDLSASERARWVADLVAAGTAVCELTPLRSSLEQEFARTIEEEFEEER